MALLRRCVRREARRASVSGMWRAAITLLALASFGLTTHAQDRDNPARHTDSRPVVRRGTGQPILDGQGWMVLAPAGSDGEAGRGHSLLLHLPAREVGGESGTGAENMQGVIREVGEVPDGPAVEGERVAWWRNRVYIAIEVEPGQIRRRVLMREAIRSVGSFYEYRPVKKFTELPELPTIAPMLGMAATEQGPVVLVRERSSAGGGVEVSRLWSLAGAKWVPIDLPWKGESGEVVQLMSARAGVLLASREASAPAITMWEGKIRQEGEAIAVQWNRTECELGELYRVADADLHLAFVEGDREAADAIVGVVFTDAEASIYQLRPMNPPVELSVVPGVPRGATIIPMSSPGEAGSASGIVTLMWRVDESAAKRVGGDLPGLQIREVSTLTGRVMYAGAAKAGHHAERPMVQWVVVVAMLVGIGVLVYFLSSDPRSVPGLSRGMRPADPIRRLLAAMLDYAPSAIVVALAQGRSALVMLDPHTLLGGAEPSLGNLDLRPLGLVIGVTILHTSLCEWGFGKSLGKFVMGVRVVSSAASRRLVAAGSGASVESEDRGGEMVGTPGLGQALIRNTVRWVVPMLAVFGMLDVAGRHPGDLAARTLVVADANDGH